MEFLLQHGIYKTGRSNDLLELLSKVWINDHSSGSGSIYIISGFANYNGGVRFYPIFQDHSRNGGKIKVIFSGSTSQRLTSLQVVEALLKCNADVYVVNRKRLLHAKLYGVSDPIGEDLVVTSGNFTGPGMSQNIEAAIRVDKSNTIQMNFSWDQLFASILAQHLDVYQMNRSDIMTKTNPGWKLLYDEVHSTAALTDTQLISMVVTLSHSDTARIQADPGTDAGKGTQYFWLSKGSFDFFPALTEKNQRGRKNTYSCLINLTYADLNITKSERVTFEADNNLDFRLGTSAFRYTKKADESDIALITRSAEYDYKIRIIPKGSKSYSNFLPYATTFIGHQGKKFGFISNTDADAILKK